MSKVVTLETGVTYVLPIKNGQLRLDVCPEEDYPGIDVEYVSDSEDKNRTKASLPRVVIECPKDTNELRALVWNNPDEEDYTDEIVFEEA